MAAHRCTDADQIVLFSGQQTRDRGGGVLAEIADLKDFFARFVADHNILISHSGRVRRRSQGMKCGVKTRSGAAHEFVFFSA